MTATAKVFQNGKSQAIRIPKGFRVDSDEVLIEKKGDTLIIKPKSKNKWDKFFDSLGTFSDDFMSERVQPEQQKREDIF